VDLEALGAVLALGAALYVGVAAYVWRHRRAVGARALTLFLLAAGVWTICNAVEVSLLNPHAQEAWGDVKFVGIVLVPPSLLAFALEYTGRCQKLARRVVAALAIEPVVVVLTLAIPATRTSVRYVPESAPYGVYTPSSVGWLFYVHLVYSYALILTAVVMLVIALVQVSRQHSRAWVIIACCVLPLGLNLAYNVGFADRLAFDPTPLGFTVAALVLVYGFFRFHLFDLVPVGRGQVVELMPDAVLVLDAHDRVADANPAAARLVGGAPSDLVGLAAQDLVPELGPLLAAPHDVHSAEAFHTTTAAGAPVDLSVTLSPLADRSRPTSGRLVVLRDVTVQRDVERRLRDLVAERTGIIETLQRGLYPAQLPDIPGLTVGAVLDPAELETNIGGDFVDVRASGSARWTLMVGDVVGKGASAATLTALARHTTVALTALGWATSAVLSEVSRAIAVDEEASAGPDEARFCTLALATVEPLEGGGAEVVLSLGGHPRPMLVTGRGDVTEVGVPGSLLGVLTSPELHDVRLRLAPGESLVMFTDGVTEARRGDDPFGEHRLAGLLSRSAALPAQRVAEEVVRAVRAYSAGAARDDVAVLVLAVPEEPTGASAEL